LKNGARIRAYALWRDNPVPSTAGAEFPCLTAGGFLTFRQIVTGKADSDHGVAEEYPMKKISPQDALVYIMITTSAADTTMTDAELESIGNVVTRLPVFRGFDTAELPRLANECYALLAYEDGLEKILDLAHEALPEKLYDTAYALAVEVAAADLHVEQEELEFLQMLRDRWTLDELTVAAIERSARVRFRKL